MSEDSRNEITVRVIRDGLEPPDNDWSMVSPPSNLFLRDSAGPVKARALKRMSLEKVGVLVT